MAEHDVAQRIDPHAEATDGELVSRWVAHRDEAAFETLMRRHGPMVFGVCRRVLGNDQDAADAFQATFLVLVRKAASLRTPAALASWLYGVAHRTAQALRRADATRSAKEAQAMPVPPNTGEQWSDALAILEEELTRLPEAYRAVVMLSDLEGRTRAEVARNCGCAEGTVASRLARGRALLARRLKRRAIALPLAALTAALAEQSVAAALPETLLAATTKAASLFAAGQPASGVLSCKGAGALEGVLQTMFQAKLKNAVVVAALLLAATVSGGLAYHASRRADEANTAPAPPSPARTSAKSGFNLAPDSTFGQGGYAVDAAGARSDDAFRNLAVDAQGRPVAAGNALGLAFAVRRYALDGSPDATFATTGTVRVCIEANETVGSAPENDRDRPQFTHGMTIDARGRIIVVGKASTSSPERANDFAILRFRDDGTLDPTFNQSGFVKLQASNAWNIGLAATTSADAAELMVAGYALSPNSFDPLLVRLDEAGQPDQAFGDQARQALRTAIGVTSSALATGVCIDEAGRYLVALQMRHDMGYYRWAVARLERDGLIDETFGRHGLWSEALDPAAADEAAFSVLRDERGRIILAGYSTEPTGLRRLAVARLQSDGTLDTTFGKQGRVIFEGYGAKVTHKYGPRAAVCEGLIAVAGVVSGGDQRYCFGLAVLDDTGTKTSTLPPRAFPGARGNDQPWGIAFDPERRVLIAGSSVGWTNKKRFAVARYVVE